VAVAPSPELAAIFEGFGATTVPGGQTMNPSVGQLLKAIEATGSARVLVLPNNDNIVTTAREAGRLARRPVRVIPTTTIPQGVAAAVAFLPARAFDENVQALEAAAAAVTTVEVTTASRTATLDGVRVERGQAMALAGGRVLAAGASADDVALQSVRQVVQPEHTLLTLYRGRDVPTERADALAEQLRTLRQDLEVELVTGGQPHYAYIVALE
jgi:dihydroxyacetone kinase-like predicted kinase